MTRRREFLRKVAGMFLASLLPPRGSLYLPYGVQHGMGVPIQLIDPATWPMQDVPFVTWDGKDYGRANHIPMVYRSTGPSEKLDDGRPLLVFNEPEDVGQANLSPQDAAAVVSHLKWNGPLYLGGNVWHNAGWDWFNEFLNHYSGRMDGIHLHAYIRPEYMYYAERYAPRWRTLADENKWDIIVSEWFMTDLSKMAEFADMIDSMVKPSMMFYFSWRYNVESDAVNEDGQWTEYGDMWQSIASKSARVWMPYIGR